MKAALFTLVTAAVVSAQNFGDVPECARDCLTDGIQEAGCDLDDTACACEPGTQTRLQGIVGPCLLSSCDSDDVMAARSAGEALCEGQESASGTATREDQGTTGTMSAMPTDIIPPGGPVTPGGPSATTISGIVTPPAGGNDTTVSVTSTATEGGSTGGSGDGDGDDDGSDGDGDDTDAASMPTAGLFVALLAAAIAI